MADYVNHNYFEELAKAVPADICRRNRCGFNDTTKRYLLHVWGDEFRIDYTMKEISRTHHTAVPLHDFFYLFIIYYLLLRQDIKLTGAWVSEKDLPGGTTFFRGPHLLPTNLITERFANDLQGLRECCKNLGGTPLSMADASFSFKITEDIPVALLYWVGDEDFPAEAKILYDRGICEILPLDIVFALAYEVCSRIGGFRSPS